MKRIFIQKPEPLLMVVPLLLFIFYKLLSGGATDDVQLASRQLGGLDSALIFWYLFGSVFVPVLIHHFLRTSRRWNPSICRPHVYLTIGLSIMLFIAFYSSNSALPPAFYKRPSPNIIGYFQISTTFAWLLLFGFLLQNAFVGYYLVRIFKRN